MCTACAQDVWCIWAVRSPRRASWHCWLDGQHFDAIDFCVTAAFCNTLKWSVRPTVVLGTHFAVVLCMDLNFFPYLISNFSSLWMRPVLRLWRMSRLLISPIINVSVVQREWVKWLKIQFLWIGKYFLHLFCHRQSLWLLALKVIYSRVVCFVVRDVKRSTPPPMTESLIYASVLSTWTACGQHINRVCCFFCLSFAAIILSVIFLQSLSLRQRLCVLLYSVTSANVAVIKRHVLIVTASPLVMHHLWFSFWL